MDSFKALLSIMSGTAVFVIVLTIIFLVYRCLHAKIKTKQIQMVRALFTNIVNK